MAGLTYETIDPKVRRLIMLGMAIAMFASCFDGTIVAILQVKITETWNDSAEIVPLLMTSYMLLETLMIPVSGKLSDQYGRKKLFIIGTVVFTIGSLVAALAPNPWTLIIGRGIQGAGGGTIIPVATAAVADLYAPEMRGRMQGILGAIFGIGMGIGPVIGGVIAEINIVGYESWRLAFWINVPIAIISIVMTMREFPEMNNDISKEIDYKGLTLLMLILIDLILYFEMVTKQFEFASGTSAAMMLAVIILLILFVRTERKAEEPIIAPHVFKNMTVTQSVILYFFCGFSLVGIELFSNMYSQKVLGMGVLESGLYIVVLVIGMTIAALVTGRYVNRTGSKTWIILGSIITVVGLIMFTFLDTAGIGSQKWYYGLALLTFGVGAGLITTPVITAVQNSCKSSEVGMTTSTVNLFRNIGSTVSTTVFSLIATVTIRAYSSDYISPDYVAKELGEKGLNIIEWLDLNKLVEEFTKLTPSMINAVMDGIKAVYTYAIDNAFAIAAITGIVMLIVSLFYKDVRIGDNKDEEECGESEKSS